METVDSARLASNLLTLPTLLGVSLCALVFAIIRSYVSWNARSRGLPLPPGPRPLPLVGSLLNWPKSPQWVAFRDMCAKYGDVLYFDLFGTPTIILGSPSAMLELLDKRAANTSSRSTGPMLLLTGMETNFGSMPYGSCWRLHKRVFWQEFHPGAVRLHLPAQRKASRMFLGKLLKSPSKLRKHVRFTFFAAILKAILGVDVAGDDEALLDVVEAALEWRGEALLPGKYLVSAIPILQYVPPWFPGATVQRLSVYWRSTVARLKEECHRCVEKSNGEDCAGSRMIARMEAEKRPAELAEEVIKNVLHTAIEAGSDTMFSTLQSFFLAMSLYPEVQRRAQAELEAVVGTTRLPDFDDIGSLVYVSALIREVLRWHNVAPLGAPHMTVEDAEFRGYFIPAGTNVFPNVWACMHDPDIYADPDVFRPERFIHDGKLDFSTAPDPAMFIFGFGRRICPGRYFAENGLFINVAAVLHVFDITPPVDENGRVIKIEPQLTYGSICYPADCRCTIKPRSAQAEALIREAQLFD